MPAITLVTGATGTVGREVVRGLLAQGLPVRAGARAGRRLVHLGPVDCCVLDFDRPQTTARALEGVQRVFFLSPLNAQMVDVGCRFVEQARTAGVEHIVRLSAMGAGSFPATKLAVVHRAVEEAIEASGLHYTFLRPNAFMQNYLNAFGGSIRSKGLFEMPQGRGAVSCIDVRDIAAVAVAALMDPCHRERSYELTGPEPLANDDVAEILSEVVHRPIRYVDISERQARDAMLGQGTPVWLVEVLLELYAISRAGMAASISSAVQELLGRPPTRFRQFAADYAEQFR